MSALYQSLENLVALSDHDPTKAGLLACARDTVEIHFRAGLIDAEIRKRCHEILHTPPDLLGSIITGGGI